MDFYNGFLPLNLLSGSWNQRNPHPRVLLAPAPSAGLHFICVTFPSFVIPLDMATSNLQLSIMSLKLIAHVELFLRVAVESVSKQRESEIWALKEHAEEDSHFWNSILEMNTNGTWVDVMSCWSVCVEKNPNQRGENVKVWGWFIYLFLQWC